MKEQNVNKAYDNFERIVTEAAENNATIIEKKIRDLRCPWSSPEITKLIKTRDYYLMYVKAKQSGNDYWYKYKRYRNDVTSKIRKSKIMYMNLLERGKR